MELIRKFRNLLSTKRKKLTELDDETAKCLAKCTGLSYTNVCNWHEKFINEYPGKIFSLTNSNI